MSTSRQNRTQPPAPPLPVEVPIDEATGSNIMVRQQAFTTAQQILASYLDGLCAGLKRSPASYRGVKMGENGLPVALLFEPVVTLPKPPNGVAKPLDELGVLEEIA